MTALKFGRGNAKLGKDVLTFSLPAGYTCPGALQCLAFAKVHAGKASIVDGPAATFRCFAASDEAMYKGARESRWHNWNALEDARQLAGISGMLDLILSSLPLDVRLVRVHVSGDFYRPEYLKAWLKVAELRPQTTFYAYTKSVSIVVAEARANAVPSNFKFTLSLGGRQDRLIPASSIRSARVFLSEEEAERAGLPVDHDDSHAQGDGASFALVIHGTQRKGSLAAQATVANKALGFTGYHRTK